MQAQNIDRIDGTTLNRTVLGRQMLLARAAAGLPEVLEAMGGLQAQYAPSSYVGLWSRRQGFRREHLDDALRARTVVQGTLMRSTIHLVAAADYHLFAAGVRRARRTMFLRVTKPAVSEAEMVRLAGVTRRLLEGGPLKRAELMKELKLSNHLWSGVGLWIDLVRVPPAGTWEHRRADIYGLAEQWIEPQDPSPEEGLRHLIRRYLAAFGPAGAGDVASWSGVAPGEIRAGLEQMELRRYEDSAGKALFDLPGLKLGDPDVQAPPRLLGTWEALLLAHARRAGILPEEYRPVVFHVKNPQSVYSFTAGGRVAGSWRLESKGISITPFRELPEETLEAVRREGVELAAALE